MIFCCMNDDKMLIFLTTFQHTVCALYSLQSAVKRAINPSALLMNPVHVHPFPQSRLLQYNLILRSSGLFNGQYCAALVYKVPGVCV